MQESLYRKNPNILNKICALKEYLVKNNKIELQQKIKYKNKEGLIKIRLNTYNSPDGAKGMFLLAPKGWLEPPNLKSISKALLYKGDLNTIQHYINSNQKEFLKIYQNRDRLQEQLEFLTKKILQSKDIDIRYPDSKNYNINDYDFLINSKIALEVKSDKYYNTGNISLELLREYNIKDCSKNLNNLGSILKNKADIWQEYFYNKSDNFTFETFVYYLPTLQKFTNSAIDILYNNFCKNEVKDSDK